MNRNKYYDWASNTSLSESDGCDFAQWEQRHTSHAFSVHPAGFSVFLKPDKLLASDEYSEEDPHHVEQGLQKSFQKRRIDCTLELIRTVTEKTGTDAKMLDLGCGQGHISAEIKNKYPSMEMSGLDYSISAIEFAASHFDGIDFCVADAYTPPYRKEHFDVVVCNNLWEHVPDPLRLLDGVRRVLRPEGYLIMSTPSRYRIENIAQALLGKRTLLMASNHVTEYSIGQVKEQLAFGRFTVEKVFSRPKKERLGDLQRFLGYKVLKPVIRLYLRIVNSHHSLESTIFYLARQNKA